jgi:hypothetical protein
MLRVKSNVFRVIRKKEVKLTTTPSKTTRFKHKHMRKLL